MLKFKNILGNAEKQEKVDVINQLFERYSKNQPGSRLEDFYQKIESIVFDNVQIDDGVDEGRFVSKLTGLKIFKQGDKIGGGVIEYELNQIDEDNKETGYSEAGSQTLSSEEAESIVRGMEELISKL